MWVVIGGKSVPRAVARSAEMTSILFCGSALSARGTERVRHFLRGVRDYGFVFRMCPALSRVPLFVYLF